VKLIAFLFAAAAMGVGLVAVTASTSGQGGDASPAFVTKMPSGYRDWKFTPRLTKQATSTASACSWAMM
jgi:hypothetical protein